MKINLITKEQFEIISNIQESNPILTFENIGYQYIDKSKFNESDKKAFLIISEILKNSVFGFVEFNNFRIKNNKIQIRLQYHYDYSFTGVGYIYLHELLNGFDN